MTAQVGSPASHVDCASAATAVAAARSRASANNAPSPTPNAAGTPPRLEIALLPRTGRSPRSRVSAVQARAAYGDGFAMSMGLRTDGVSGLLRTPRRSAG